jgi:hypothetical protein
VGIGSSRHYFAMSFFFGPHLSSHIDLGSGNMTVHINSTRHNDKASGIEGLGRFSPLGRGGYDLSICDPEVLHLTIDAM